jgi:hypothetical protein
VFEERHAQHAFVVVVVTATATGWRWRRRFLAASTRTPRNCGHCGYRSGCWSNRHGFRFVRISILIAVQGLGRLHAGLRRRCTIRLRIL